MGRCVDAASAAPCLECLEENLTGQQLEQCEAMQVTAGQGALAGLQCKAF